MVIILQCCSDAAMCLRIHYSFLQLYALRFYSLPKLDSGIDTINNRIL